MQEPPPAFIRQGTDKARTREGGKKGFVINRPSRPSADGLTNYLVEFGELSVG